MSSAPSHGRSPRRGAYLIPSLFTGLNVCFGYLAITEAFRAGQLVLQSADAAAPHFDLAAKFIGWAVVADGMDGRIARLMGTTSPFGQELDSLADTITFGIAPAVLALSWGVLAILPAPETGGMGHLAAAGWLVTFVFILCSAARLARFNIQGSPSDPHPERFDHKYFVGLPTPAAAGLVAAVVHANSGSPIGDWLWVPFWLVVLLGTSLLMVSTWRYHSFKHLDLRRKQKFVVVIAVGAIVGSIYYYSQIVLLLIATSYLLSGVLAKLAQTMRRGRVEARTHEPKPWRSH